MKVLVLGATGATGKQLVKQLMNRDTAVRILIREQSTPPAEFIKSPLVEIVKGSVSEYSTNDMVALIGDCDAVVSCLGHNITFKGMFGNPRNLVTDTVKVVSDAIKLINKRVKFILMSTTGYTNSKNDETNTAGEKIVLSLLKLLLPPHRDNIRAGDYLTKEIGRNDLIDWIAVRPDSLIENDEVTNYDVVNTPLRSPIFDPGKASRINVAHLMAELLTNDSLWQKWRGKTPVLYNIES